MSILPQMKPSEVSDGVFQLSSFGAKVTAIEHAGDLLLVDAGARGSYPLVARSLASLGYSTDRVGSIVLTHSHPDHAGALSSLAAHTGATVAIHYDDADILEKHEDAGPLFARLPERLGRTLSRYMYDGPVIPTTRFLDGAILDWPDRVEVIHTPGHTAGSVSLYVPSAKLVMVGDALQYRFKKLAGPSKVLTGDYAQALQSLCRLAELDIETIVFSHFQPMVRDAKHRLERLIERAEARRR